MYDKIRPEQEEADSLDRRALLRRGGAAVVAGVAGLAVAENVMAGSASAAAGSPVVMGAPNDAGSTLTGLTSANSTGSTLALANTANLAPLKLVEQAIPATDPALTSGDLANYGGDLYYTAGDPGGPLIGFVYSEWTANKLVPIRPQRVLDTRTVAGRANITNPSGNLDSAGRLIARHTIVIDLSGLEFGAEAAYCNVTVVSPLGSGYATLWPGGARPVASSINYVANAVIANFAVTGTSLNDTVSLFSAATTHLILDVTGFAVGSPVQIDPAILSSAGPSATRERIAARAKAGKMPTWSAAH
jgi:hypothetical protein